MEGRLIGDGREFVVQLAIASLFLSFYVCFTSFLPRPTYYFLFSSANAADGRGSSTRVTPRPGYTYFRTFPARILQGPVAPRPPPRLEESVRNAQTLAEFVRERARASPSDCRRFRDKLTTVSPCGRTMEREKSRGARGGGKKTYFSNTVGSGKQ